MRTRTGQLTYKEVRDASGDPRGVPGRVGEPSGRSGIGRENLWLVLDGSGVPREGP